MTKYLASAPKFQAWDASGNPLSGGLVYTYASGASSTPLATYTDATGGTANANPVVLDSSGTANIWFTPGVLYRIVLKNSAATTTYYTVDSVAGSVTPSTYFATIMGDTTAGQVFTDVVAAGGTITGTILMSGAALNMAAAVTVASATSTEIGAAASNNITVSGVATITSFDTVTAGIIRYVTFSGVLTLTYNATSMILPGAASITTAAGDVGLFQSLGSGNWKCLVFQKADGTAVAVGTTVATQAQMEAATSLVTTVTPGRTQYHPGVAKAWVTFDGTSAAIGLSYNVTSVVRNSTGLYTITFTTAFSSASYAVVGTCTYPDATQAQGMVGLATSFTHTAGVCQVATSNALSGSYSQIDASNVSVVFFGDQA